MTPCIKQEAHGITFVTNRLGYDKGRQLRVPTLPMHTHHDSRLRFDAQTVPSNTKGMV